MCKGFFHMWFSSRTKEANEVGREVVSARIAFERTNNELAKTLDEMLEATNAANRRRDRSQRNAVSTGKPKDH